MFKRNREEKKNRKPEYKSGEKKRPKDFFFVDVAKYALFFYKTKIASHSRNRSDVLFSGQNKKQKN